MKLSLILATRNRAVELSRFLECLASIKSPLEWEIIIADNGSNDGTAAVLDEWASKLPLKTVHVAKRGKSRALNAALALAKGELILFTDDDIIPCDEWLLRWRDKLESYPQTRVFGGPVYVDASSLPNWIVNSVNLQEMLLSIHDFGDQDRAYPFNRYPIGPNMAVRRDAWFESGARWPEELGPGTCVPMGDERAFLSQLSRPGDSNRVYLADVPVVHCPDATRLTRIRCWKRCFLGGFAAGGVDRFIGVPRMPSGGIALSRLRGCRSISELIAMACRAIGVFAGRWSTRLGDGPDRRCTSIQ